MSLLAHSRRAALALAFAVNSLAGCGGGDASDATPAPSPSPADYLRIGVVSDDANAGKTVVVFDIDQPETPRLSLRLALADRLVVSPALSVKLVPLTSTILGDSVLYVVKGMQLHRLSLKKSDTTVLQRISSISTACDVTVDLLNPDGTGWLRVYEAGPDQDCSTISDNRTVFVQPDAAPTTAPVQLPEGVRLITSLYQASSTTPQHLLALDTQAGRPARLTLYRPDLSLLGEVAGGQVDSAEDPFDHFTTSQMWLRTGNALRSLTWTSEGATLSSQSVYTFTHHVDSSFADSSALYFADGLDIVRFTLEGTSQVIARLDVAAGPEARIEATQGDRLLIRQVNDSTLTNTLFTLMKNGGTPQMLASGSALYHFALSQNTVYYVTYTGTYADGDYNAQSSLHRINLDGSGAQTLTTRAHNFPGPFVKRTVSALDWDFFDGAVWCEPAEGALTCANGTLKMLNAATGVTTELGRFSHDAAFGSWSPFDYNNLYGIPMLDLPMVLLSRGTRKSDGVAVNELYIARPGVANSLVKVNVSP